MVTELSRYNTYNLEVAFFKTLISRSYLINFLIAGGFLWLARTVCYSQLNLTSDRLATPCRFYAAFGILRMLNLARIGT